MNIIMSNSTTTLTSVALEILVFVVFVAAAFNHPEATDDIANISYVVLLVDAINIELARPGILAAPKLPEHHRLLGTPHAGEDSMPLNDTNC